MSVETLERPNGHEESIEDKYFDAKEELEELCEPFIDDVKKIMQDEDKFLSIGEIGKRVITEEVLQKITDNYSKNPQKLKELMRFILTDQINKQL